MRIMLERGLPIVITCNSSSAVDAPVFQAGRTARAAAGQYCRLILVPMYGGLY